MIGWKDNCLYCDDEAAVFDPDRPTIQKFLQEHAEEFSGLTLDDFTRNPFVLVLDLGDYEYRFLALKGYPLAPLALGSGPEGYCLRETSPEMLNDLGVDPSDIPVIDLVNSTSDKGPNA